MNSRALLRQSSRALSSSLRSSAARQQLRSQFHNNTPLAAQRPKKDEPEAEKKEAEVEDPTKKALEAKDKEIIDLKDKLLRSIADFRNLQERTKRDMQAAKDFAIQKFAKDLVDSVDNFDRALTTIPRRNSPFLPKNEMSINKT
ncbi:hypothetical protein EYC84_000858 [Monilinia fructicola]|uniref:GrpE protein homolog, mitochondrial n=1 Tax=Monilinia fructicola TaxID=38448 RepID=A0A5M9JMH2_MONFR|nr:hypothetical protein EYC84_000858 [Monilinia fructicola]